ncbi:MAG: RelA/SpoT family protein [Treponema sp.]|jgi:GTP pyrophosphokinase|nr:RelA/SpoT family protein [Treponema sp.]
MEIGIPSFKEQIDIYTPREQEKIRQALGLMETAPAEGSVASGESTLHTLGVAVILMELNLDVDTIIAALLLDALRDSIAGKTISTTFGPHVALLVEGVRRIADISAKNKTVQEAENIRKMLFAMSQDIRVIFIHLADKLDRMRTLEELSLEQRRMVAQECLDIYAPLADRLGISWIKDELEDLSLKYLNREVYQQIKDIVALKKGERTEFLDTLQDIILHEADKMGIKVEVTSRAKHFYSIYQKMRRRNKATGDIYDFLAIRILCESIENCYTLLGMVHRLWKPLAGRFKDYIAMPKSNGYQSLHTTVMAFAAPHDAEGRSLEIQIRTGEMHHIAEYGVASHWLYKQGTARKTVRPVDISIVTRLRDWKQQEAGTPEDRTLESFLKDIKREILKGSIYVFTPQGKVIELPAGATAIDFAYTIHSAIGEHCMGAKANGAIIPLSSALQNTQIVEILTSPHAHPHINWLRQAKTSKARSKIRSWLQQHDDSMVSEKNTPAKKKVPVASPETLVPEAKEIPPVQRVIEQHLTNSPILKVRVEDEKNLMIRFAQCCRPVTGDPIVGYISRGRGIIIHRSNCSNLIHIPDLAERKIHTEWENAASVLVKHFKVEARLSADLFSEIEGAVRKYQGHLLEGRLEETTPNRLTGLFTMQLEQAENLKRVLKNIRGIPAVFSIQTLA